MPGHFPKLTYLNFDQSTAKNSCAHLISLRSVQSKQKNNNNHFNPTTTIITTIENVYTV